MNRSKIVAIMTGAISIILAIAYLILVQLLDLRGEMKPAPMSQFDQPSIIHVSLHPSVDVEIGIKSAQTPFLELA